ncbi:stage III sporulation protein AE, partial [Eggerthella lenta]|nr:stage III sporulation protein AE [Eggerthella lenta]
NVSSVFKGGQISDTGFFVTYLLLFTCLAASFSASLQVAAQVMEQILEFMKLLMPAYYMAVAFSGGSMSALALYECMLGA